jgi:hypothetical protein
MDELLDPQLRKLIKECTLKCSLNGGNMKGNWAKVGVSKSS